MKYWDYETMPEKNNLLIFKFGCGKILFSNIFFPSYLDYGFLLLDFKEHVIYKRILLICFTFRLDILKHTFKGVLGMV